MKTKVNWGILSTAYIGIDCIIPAMKDCEFGIITAIASRDLAAAQKVANQFAIPKAYGSYEELLSDE